MMDIDFLPLHLIILGGNYVGLEFAQIYCRFGSEVTVIEFAPRLIPREDEDVSKAVLDILKDEGVNVRVDSKVIGLQREGNAIVVKVESARKMSPTAGSPQHGDSLRHKSLERICWWRSTGGRTRMTWAWIRPASLPMRGGISRWTTNSAARSFRHDRNGGPTDR